MEVSHSLREEIVVLLRRALVSRDAVDLFRKEGPGSTPRSSPCSNASTSITGSRAWQAKHGRSLRPDARVRAWCAGYKCEQCPSVARGVERRARALESPDSLVGDCACGAA